MTSQVEICNLALSRIGAGTISAIDEDTREARTLLLHYEPTLRSLLRAHEWNFAKKRVVLAQLSTAPVSEYAYQYALPSDFLKVCRINGAFTDEYRLEGSALLSDEDPVTLEYVHAVTDPNLFDAIFTDVLAQKLASEIAYALTENNGLTESVFRIYSDKLREARTMNARDGTPRNIEASTWLDARA